MLIVSDILSLARETVRKICYIITIFRGIKKRGRNYVGYLDDPNAINL